MNTISAILLAVGVLLAFVKGRIVQARLNEGMSAAQANADADGKLGDFPTMLLLASVVVFLLPRVRKFF